MTTVLYLLLILAPFALLYTAFCVIKQKRAGKPLRKAFSVNLATFAALAVLLSVLCFSAFAAETDAPDAQPAQTETTEQAAPATDNAKGMGLLAAGLVTGLAGIGGGIAVAAGAPAAISATAENPKSFGKSIIFVALGESIALYGVVISILILNKV